MVGVLEKHAQAQKTPQKLISTVPQRELKKRKGVRFEDTKVQNSEEMAASTSDFIYAENKQWEFVASCFDLVDENRNDHRDGEKDELLGLCNFFETEEKQPHLTEDSDDPLPYEIFAEQGMRITYQTQLAPVPSVSTICLTTKLRLESRSRIATAQFETHKESNFEEKEDLEKAFQGILPCSNSQKAKRAASFTEQQPEPQSAPEEDFWSNVEF